MAEETVPQKWRDLAINWMKQNCGVTDIRDVDSLASLLYQVAKDAREEGYRIGLGECQPSDSKEPK